MKLRYTGKVPKTFPIGELQPGEEIIVPDVLLVAASYLSRNDFQLVEEPEAPRKRRKPAGGDDAAQAGEDAVPDEDPVSDDH